jgi:hypothetical protein
MNLFIVESPFQLLSAIEASHFFASNSNLLIVKYLPEEKNSTKNSNNNNQLDLLIQLKSWDKIIKIKHKSSYFLSDLKLLFYIKKISKVNLIFIGELRSWYMRQYFNILDNNGCYLLDDGSASIVMQETVISNRSYYRLKNIKFNVKILINYLISLIYFLKFYKINSHINLFTCFEIKECFKDQKILKNNFEYCKEITQERNTLTKTVYFFGGVEDSEGILDANDLLNELLKVNEYFISKGIKFFYVSHRRETKEKLNKIENALRCKILSFKYPAELEFVLMNESPEYISSFCSTALYTISSMFEYRNKSISFLLPLDKMSSLNKSELGSIYRHYEEHMTLIDLGKDSHD